MNQLHAFMRESLPGGAPTDLTAAKPQSGPAWTASSHHHRPSMQIPGGARLRSDDTTPSSRATPQKWTKLLDLHGTTLRSIPRYRPCHGGPDHRPHRAGEQVPNAAAYANYTGVAPIEVAGADSSRHRLSRYDVRELNSALHTIAIIQIRMTSSIGHS